MNEPVKSKLKQLEGMFDNLIKAGLDLHSHETTAMSLYINAILHRSSGIIFGFSNLIRSQNYLTAGILVRCHLDSFFKMYATTLVADPNDFSKSVLAGKHIRNLKDRNGNKLSDNYLKQTISEKIS